MVKILVALVLLAASASAILPAPRNVEGIEDCGSVGQVLGVGVTDCTKVPCQLEPGRSYDIDIDFISTVGMFQVNLKINAVFENGQVVNLYDVPVQGNIKPNEPFNLHLAFPVTDRFSGQSFKLQLQLWHYETDEMEICASAAVNVL